MTKNNYHTDIKKPNPCSNGCKRWVAWEPTLLVFVEAETGRRHECPKWKTKLQQQNSQTDIIPTEQEKNIDTSNLPNREILRLVEELSDSLHEVQNRLKGLKIENQIIQEKIKNVLKDLLRKVPNDNNDNKGVHIAGLCS